MIDFTHKFFSKYSKYVSSKYVLGGALSLFLVSLLWHSEVLSEGLTSWKSGKNHNRLIQLQNNEQLADNDFVEVSYFSNSSFKIVSPQGVSMIVDPWRNDPSGAWGLWYRLEYPPVEVDIGMSTHAHFDHDALDKIDASMLLDRMTGEFQLADVKITGIADKHQCVAPGVVVWTDAVKQFEGRDNVCPPTNARHFDNNIYLIETAGMKLLVWGDNRPYPPPEVMERIGKVDVVIVPVDGSKHILDYKQADDVVKAVDAKIAIPHHYLVPSTTFVTSTLQTAEEWTKTHPHTLLSDASVKIRKSDLAGKQGHVYYFGSNNMVKQ